jgi:hypothetical protein
VKNARQSESADVGRCSGSAVVRYTGHAANVAARAADGIYTGKGWPTSIDATMVCELKDQGLGVTEIAKGWPSARACVYYRFTGRCALGASSAFCSPRRPVHRLREAPPACPKELVRRGATPGERLAAEAAVARLRASHAAPAASSPPALDVSVSASNASAASIACAVVAVKAASASSASTLPVPRTACAVTAAIGISARSITASAICCAAGSNRVARRWRFCATTRWGRNAPSEHHLPLAMISFLCPTPFNGAFHDRRLSPQAARARPAGRRPWHGGRRPSRKPSRRPH